MHTRKKAVLTGIAALLILAVILLLLQELFRPKYGYGNIPEGTLIADYYDEAGEAGGHDVIFIGDCEVYENFSPITLWEEYGITSYIRGSAQQLIWQSYYLLEDTLRYEKPDVVVFNVLSMQYGTPQSEAYNRLNLDGMRLSVSKIKAVLASMTEEESLVSYLFPLLRYHDRWSELTVRDFTGMFETQSLSHNGFLMRADVKAAENVPTGRPLPSYAFADTCWEYLEAMRALCEREGVELILIKAPSLYPYWYEQWDEQIQAYAEEKGLRYLNFLEMTDTIGIDFSTDTYDGGLHLNLSGAEKLSDWFGAYLAEELGLSDRRGESDTAAVWAEKAARYHAMEADQLRELEEYGYLKSYGAKAPQ